MVIAHSDAAGTRSFPARIAAPVRVGLSFRMPGTVKELPVKESDRLQEGNLTARLDSTDYQIVVDDKRATYEKAEKKFERGKKLTFVFLGAVAEWWRGRDELSPTGFPKASPTQDHH